jgi:hypothetical protein
VLRDRCSIKTGRFVGNWNLTGLWRLNVSLAAVALHPVTRGLNNDYWAKLGRLLQKTTAQGSHCADMSVFLISRQTPRPVSAVIFPSVEYRLHLRN